jgi:GTP-binding protein
MSWSRPPTTPSRTDRVAARAEFVTSAAAVTDLPRDGAPELALVGRSNVGKSSLINALAGRAIARTSATPGKTRLLNVYRVVLRQAQHDPEPGRRVAGRDRPCYLVDLPGYGYARGGTGELRSLARAYAEARLGGRDGGAALLLVDARHPGLENDLAAYDWLASLACPAAVVATKLDKLTRAERPRARQALETAFHGPVLPVSAVSGEGLKDLWKLIDRLLSRQPPRLQPRRPS